MASGKKDIFDIIIAMRVNVLVLDGVFDLGLSAVLDVFQTANEVIEMTFIWPSEKRNGMAT